MLKESLFSMAIDQSNPRTTPSPTIEVSPLNTGYLEVSESCMTRLCMPSTDYPIFYVSQQYKHLK